MADAIDKNECYTIKEVVELLKTSRQNLYKWRKKGKINVVKINNKILIKKSEVERLLQENIE